MIVVKRGDSFRSKREYQKVHWEILSLGIERRECNEDSIKFWSVEEEEGVSKVGELIRDSDNLKNRWTQEKSLGLCASDCEFWE